MVVRSLVGEREEGMTRQTTDGFKGSETAMKYYNGLHQSVDLDSWEVMPRESPREPVF